VSFNGDGLNCIISLKILVDFDRNFKNSYILYFQKDSIYHRGLLALNNYLLYINILLLFIIIFVFTIQTWQY
jgi:hypothetical protein